MTLIDLFREFSLKSSRENYSPSSRILYYTLLWCWNEQRRPEVAILTIQELITLTGLSRTTFKRAFNYLSDRGWVKRVKSRNSHLMAWIMRDGSYLVVTPADFPMDARTESSDERREKFSPKKIFPFVPKEQEDNLKNDNLEGKTEPCERTLEETLFAE